MRARDSWLATKYEHRGDRWRGSRNPRELAPGSRLIADLVAAAYAEHAPVHAAGRLLDLGCGKSPQFGIFQPVVTDVTAVDWPNTLHGNTYADLLHDLNEPLPFRNAEFRTILLSDVLEHLSEPRALWREMHRVLEPGGRILLNTPFLYPIHEAPHDHHRFTEFALRRQAADAGCEVLVLEVLGGAHAVLADFMAKHLQRVPYLGEHMAAAAQAGISRRSARQPALRDAPRTAYPLGYFMVAGKPK